jgi:hypothetical protein
VSAGKLADFLEKVINVENKHIGKQIKPREVESGLDCGDQN